MKHISIIFFVCMLSFYSCSKNDKNSATVNDPEPTSAGYSIAILSWNGNGDEIRAAERLIKRYKSATDGGVILFARGPNDSASGLKSYSETAISLARNNKVKAIIFCPSPNGTAEIVERIKNNYPSVLCYVAMPEEDPLLIQASKADLIVSFSTERIPDVYALCAGLAEYAKTVVDKLYGKDLINDLVKEIKEYSTEKGIKGRHYVDAASSVRSKNHIELFYVED